MTNCRIRPNGQGLRRGAALGNSWRSSAQDSARSLPSEGSVPGREARIPQAMWHGQNQKTENKKKTG